MPALHQDVPCPGCGLSLPSLGPRASGNFNNSAECGQRYDELSAFTLSLADPTFLHQLAVDAYGAQHADGKSPSIRTAFALAGLYLAIERGFSGRQVQRAHTLMARRPRPWPVFALPPTRGALTVRDVLGASGDRARCEALRAWGEAVWAAWSSEREQILALVRETLDET